LDTADQHNQAEILLREIWFSYLCT